jgi:hypothetical protein
LDGTPAGARVAPVLPDPVMVVRVLRHKNVTLSHGCGIEEQIRHAGVRRVSETCISFALRSPTTSSQQHGRKDAPMSTKSHAGSEHHETAADHHESAAHHHREAAKHYEGGDPEKAGHHAHVAHAHGLHATHHAHEAAKHHAEHHSEEDAGDDE